MPHTATEQDISRIFDELRAHRDTLLRRARVRSYARVCKFRGKLIQQSCADCLDPHSEMHHEDYDRPLDVIWLCRLCHVARHRAA